jgi:ubiquinone/menaquinone biosynthesis C-methylase UbiE
MPTASFDRVSFLYNILEKRIFREHETVKEIINDYIILKENFNVIDIGGGTGVNTEFIVNEGYDVTLLDFSRSMLLVANNTKLKTILGDGTCLPVKNRSYDVALLISALHHIDKNLHQNSINESFRILKPGGKTYVIEIFPPGHKAHEKIKRFYLRIINILLFKRLNMIFFKIEQLIHGKTFHQEPSVFKSMFEKSGFKDIKIIQPKNCSSKYIVCGTK